MGQDFLDIQFASVLVTDELIYVQRWKLDMVDIIDYINISSAKAPCPGKIYISVWLFCQAGGYRFFAKEGGKILKAARINPSASVCY